MFSGRRALVLLGTFLAIYLGVRYVLPVAAPFLLGALLALAAEPAVRFGIKKAKLPRSAAAGVGVTGVLLLLGTLLFVTGAFTVRELGVLAGALPDLGKTARDGMQAAQDFFVDAASKAPEAVRPMLTDMALNFFDDGTALVDGVTRRLPGVITGFLSGLPNGALKLGTGVLAGFMISARLPKLKAMAKRYVPEEFREKYVPAVQKVRHVLGLWLVAQLKLALITYAIVTAGFLLMGISYAPGWAALVALVDAVPLLGTGTVLIPCALVSLFCRMPGRALGYICLYLVAFGVRSVLEPRMVGRHLGIDPLLTLVCIYVGYHFWGFWGLLLAPMLASAALQLSKDFPRQAQ